MVQTTHSFIDIAVLEAVRGPFLRGDALALLSEDLGEVLWANGPGAALLRLGDIEAARGAPANIPYLARRQIEAAPGFPRITGEHAVVVRLTPGSGLNATVRSVALPSGVDAVLLKAPAPAWADADAPARAISGIAEAGHFAALLDGEGRVLAASEGFAALGVAADELAALARDVAGEPDRLAKRMVRTADQLYPAGVARLSDEPGRHMVIIVDDPQPLEDADEATEAEGSAAASSAAIAAAAAIGARPAEDARQAPLPSGMPRAEAAAPGTNYPDEHDTWYFADQMPARPVRAAPPAAPMPAYEAAEAEAADAGSPPSPETGEPVLADGTDAEGQEIAAAPHDEPAEPDAADDKTAAADDAEPHDAVAIAVANADDGATTVSDEAPADAAKEASDAGGAPDAGGEASQGEPDRPSAPVFRPDLTSGPVRFVWRTDAQGCFSNLSGEFAGAVGPVAADIVGQPFRDVAQRFGLDPDGDIAGLLERRDTWSGRTVMWPVEGAALRIPVDLAALPVYARDRSFEGFRGFGVARVADATADPEETGLGLTAPAETHDTADDEPTTAEPRTDPFRGEAPAISVDGGEPQRRHADKVIRLAEHRPASTERQLSSGEKLAFAEIGARLKEAQGKAANVAEAHEAESETHDATPAEASLAEAPADERTGEAPEQVPPAAETDATDSEQASAGEPRPAAGAIGIEAQEEDHEAAPEPGARTAHPQATPAEPAAASDKPERSEEAGELATPDEEEATAEVLEFTPSAFPRPPAGHAGVDTSILERLPVPVLIHSGDTLHYANEEFLRLTGYQSVRQLEYAGGLGALFAEEPDAQDAPGVDRRRRLRTRAGEEFPVEALLQSVPWHRGKALLLALKPVAAASADTGELAELEARVAEMRAILDTATDGIVMLARDGTIRSISRPAEALFGFDNETVAGKPFVSLFAVESQRAARDYLNGLSDHGVASVLNDGREVIGREAMGRFIPLFMTIGRLPGDSGFCAVLRDITQWKRAEDELTRARSEAERASSQKTEFLARISHEIRTPLNAIIGFSELMMDEKFGPIVNERYRDYLRDINRSGNHVLDLVNDLLDISKIEAGEQEMSYEAVSLNEALAEAVAMMQPQANRDRVIIRSSYASRLPEVVADLRSVRQIALNLLSNAVRFTQAGGQVIVSTAYEPSGDVVMRVRDTGIGMSQGEIEQALKPFKQINALKRARGDGTGLGLPLTKAMVEANRARFSISSAPGEGTLVEIVFPSTRVLAG